MGSRSGRFTSKGGGDILDSLSKESLAAVEEVENYLRSLMDGGETMYLHARKIEPHVSLNRTQIGMFMPKIGERENGLEVEKWGASSSTPHTWCITRCDAGDVK